MPPPQRTREPRHACSCRSADTYAAALVVALVVASAKSAAPSAVTNSRLPSKTSTRSLGTYVRREYLLPRLINPGNLATSCMLRSWQSIVAVQLKIFCNYRCLSGIKDLENKWCQKRTRLRSQLIDIINLCSTFLSVPITSPESRSTDRFESSKVFFRCLGQRVAVHVRARKFGLPRMSWASVSCPIRHIVACPTQHATTRRSPPTYDIGEISAQQGPVRDIVQNMLS